MTYGARERCRVTTVPAMRGRSSRIQRDQRRGVLHVGSNSLFAASAQPANRRSGDRRARASVDGMADDQPDGPRGRVPRHAARVPGGQQRPRPGSPRERGRSARRPGAGAAPDQAAAEALQNSGDGINWGLALEQAKDLAARSAVACDPGRAVGSSTRRCTSPALWLDEVTDITELTVEPRLLTRAEWADGDDAGLDPARRAGRAWHRRRPHRRARRAGARGADERMLANAEPAHAQRRRHPVRDAARSGRRPARERGRLGRRRRHPAARRERPQAALLPQNVAAFGDGLDIPIDQVQLYLAVRELAHARLFRHAKWLRLHLITSITEFARGIRIDTDRLEELADDFDPPNPEELRDGADERRADPAEDRRAARRPRPARDDARPRRGLGRRRHRRRRRPGCRRAGRSPRRCAGGAPPAARPSRRSRPSSGSSCVRAACARPRRCGRPFTDAVGAEARDELWAHPDLLPTPRTSTTPRRSSRASGRRHTGARRDGSGARRPAERRDGRPPARGGTLWHQRARARDRRRARCAGWPSSSIPASSVVWRTPTTVQFGVDSPVRRSTASTPADERLLAALRAGVSPSGFAMLAARRWPCRPTRRAALLERARAGAAARAAAAHPAAVLVAGAGADRRRRSRTVADRRPELLARAASVRRRSRSLVADYVIPPRARRLAPARRPAPAGGVRRPVGPRRAARRARRGPCLHCLAAGAHRRPTRRGPRSPRSCWGGPAARASAVS